MDPSSLWSRLSGLTWGWPREWEELVFIAVAALLVTLLIHLLALFIRITARAVVLGLVVLLVYSAIRGARGEPLVPVEAEPTVAKPPISAPPTPAVVPGVGEEG